MENKKENQFKHGDSVLATFGDKEYTARVEVRMVGQYPSQKEEKVLCIDGRWPMPVKDWPGTLELIEKDEYRDEIPSYGDIMTVEDFKENVKSRMFIDYDGHGYPSKNGKMHRDLMIVPSQAHQIPKDATHIVWFNK